MKKIVRKGLAFGLALTMLLGNFGNVVYADTKEENTQESSAPVYELTELEYNDAVSLDEHVVLIKNGEWAYQIWNDEINDNQNISNVSLDTELVFVDENGNKKTILNNNNGEMLFDAVYPAISYGNSEAMCNSIKIIKDGKVSYLKEDGSYYSDSLKFYGDAYVLTDNWWLVSEDGINYQIVDMRNDSVITELLDTKYFHIGMTDDCIEIETENSYILINVIEESIKKIEFECNDSFYVNYFNEKYLYVDIDEESFVIDYEGNIINTLPCSKYSWWSCYEEFGYAIVDYTVVENEREVSKFFVINLETGMKVMDLVDEPVVKGELLLCSMPNGDYQLVSFEGEIIIESIDSLIPEILKKIDFDESIYKNVILQKDYLLISVQNSIMDAKTFILKRDDNYSLDKATILDGYCSTENLLNEKYIYLCPSRSSICTYIYSLDGKLVFDFSKLNTNTIYHNMYKTLGHYENETCMKCKNVLGIVEVNDTENDMEYEFILNVDGKKSDYYTYIRCESIGDYFIAQKNDETILLNHDYDEIYKCKNAAVWLMNEKNYFVVEKDSIGCIYDPNGNLLYGNVDEGIGFIDVYKGGRYSASEIDSFIKWNYSNYLLDNGLCVVGQSINDGTDYLYGVIKIGGTINLYSGLQYDEASGNWYYYVDGNIDYTYTGLVEYYGAWYYIENGILNWNYTGLTNYYGTWYYVENGVLNWNYTGLTLYYGTWYYVENGVLNWNYTGLTLYYGTWYYVENGVLNWKYTGLTLYYDTWYYVENGVLNWGYTGLTEYYGTWYYVENGVLNWGYTGLTEYYGTWYYVENGVLNWGYTGLTEYYGAWYYVEGGILNWGFTGLVEYYGTWYYVGNGVLDWSFTGNVYQYGTWWYVENGIMIREANVG